MLGGKQWGGFSAWISAIFNFLGQIAGAASCSYSGAVVISEIITITSGKDVNSVELLGLCASLILFSTIANLFPEYIITMMCYISSFWNFLCITIILIWMLIKAPRLQSASFLFTKYNNEIGIDNITYVILIGSLSAAYTITGFDSVAHIAEEVREAHRVVPLAMIGGSINALVLGFLLIIGMNACIQDFNGLLDSLANAGPGQLTQAYAILWQETVGDGPTILFLLMVALSLLACTCSSLTSASRIFFSLARDNALPFSKFIHHISPNLGTPARAICISALIEFILIIPGTANPIILSALFSLCATGIYTSYTIPILLRITIARETFQPSNFNLGKFGIPFGIISVLWCCLITIILCFPQIFPITIENLNYAPIAMGIVLFYALFAWIFISKSGFELKVNNITKQLSTKLDLDNIEIENS